MLDSNQMKRYYSVQSSEVYEISPQCLRNLRLELKRRTRENAYRSHPNAKELTHVQRAERYDELKEKIRSEGFKSEFPIVVMLVRKNGNKDKILQGHHRLSMAIELGFPTVPVRFVW